MSFLFLRLINMEGAFGIVLASATKLLQRRLLQTSNAAEYIFLERIITLRLRMKFWRDLIEYVSNNHRVLRDKRAS